MNQETTTYDHMYRPGVITVNVADLRRWLKIVGEVQYGRKRADRYFYLWKNDVVSDLEVMVGEHSSAIVRMSLTGNAYAQSPSLSPESLNDTKPMLDAIIRPFKVSEFIKGKSGVVTIPTDVIAMEKREFEGAGLPFPFREELETCTQLSATEGPQWSLSIPTTEARRIFDTIGDSATTDENRITLTCINIMVNTTDVEIATTDGFQLAAWSETTSALRRDGWDIAVRVFEEDSRKGYSQHELNVPAQPLLALLRSMPVRAKDSRITIRKMANMDYRIEWANGARSWVLAGRGVEGRYPDYRKLLDLSESFTGQQVDSQLLSDSLDSAYSQTLEMFAQYQQGPGGDSWAVGNEMPRERRDPAVVLYVPKDECGTVKSVKQYFEDNIVTMPPYTIWFHYHLLKRVLRAVARYTNQVEPVLSVSTWDTKASNQSPVHFLADDGRATWLAMPTNHKSGMEVRRRDYYLGAPVEELVNA